MAIELIALRLRVRDDKQQLAHVDAGELLIMAMQARYGTHQDGKLDNPSPYIKGPCREP